MKHEFHVGDYVETKDGDIGIITKVNPDDSSCWYGSACWYCTYSRDSRTKNQTYVIPDRTNADIAKFFNRIGQYDFTKKDEGKVEPLSDNYTESFPIFKTEDNVTGKTYKQECYSIDIGVISKKINELVEAVNRLEEKVNGN